jgi:GST-like protein
MIDVYAWKTTNGLRATLAFAECDLEHRVIPVDLTLKEQKLPDYLAINPAGQIPAMVDRSAVGAPYILTQSGAIVMYACTKAGQFIPADQTRYFEALKWSMQAATDIGGASAALQQVAVIAPEKVPSIIQLFEQRLVRYFGLVDQQLAGRQFIADEITFADLMMYPNYVLRRALVDAAADFPNLRAWADRMALRPGVQRGMRLLNM